MTDLACWRQGDSTVVRINGSEHLLDESEALELCRHLEHVIMYDNRESLGEGYHDLCIAAEAAKANTNRILKALGLGKVEDFERRI